MNIKNIIYGYIIGDSYGLSVLNNEKIEDDITLKDNKELNIEKGNYSSMTVFMLATMDSLTKNKKLNKIDILNKMCTSLIVGKYTSDGKVYDLDDTTLKILKHYSTKNNLNIEYSENDQSSYSLCRILPIIIYNYYNEDSIENLENIIALTNINEDLLLGSYIYYNYIINLLNGYNKYKALYKIEIPESFNKESINKFKRILKGNLYYKEFLHNDDIVNVLSLVFYVILNSSNFKDIFMMIENIDGNTNIYGSLIGAIAGLLYGTEEIENIIKELKNKKDINKYIKSFERILKK